jgi:hypothetical protein
VVKGWNLVSVINLAQSAQGTAIDADDYFGNISWTVAYTFDTQNNSWTKITPFDHVYVGMAYWVWASASGNILP